MTGPRTVEKPQMHKTTRYHAPLALIALAALVALTGVSVQAQNSGTDWDALLKSTWEGYKTRFIFCGADCGGNLGLVHDPAAGYTAVSEGVGYGMLMAVLMDDQAAFNMIFDAANTVLWQDFFGLYHWRADRSGNVIGQGSATDADQDIALALIFAQQRVWDSQWQQHPAVPYGDRAHKIIGALYQHEVRDGRYLIPGNQWDVDQGEITSPSYFAPAWYRIFDAFQGTDRWGPVIDQVYDTLAATEGAVRGLAPDWSQTDGAPAYPWCDANGRPRQDCRYEMYYDGIRTPWRIGMDCLWFDELRACSFVNSGMHFLQNTVGRGDPNSAAILARMYDMQGNPIVDVQDGAMLGMWLAASAASDNQLMFRALSDRMSGPYATFALSNGFWGDSSDAGRTYYQQSLAWIGAAVASGRFENLYNMP